MHQIIVRKTDGQVIAHHPIAQDVVGAYAPDKYTIILRAYVPDDWSKDPRVGDEKDDSHDPKVRSYLKPRNRHEVLFRELAKGLKEGDMSEFLELVRRTFG